MDPQQVIGWFGARTPVSATGAIRLGGALIASGRREEGAALIRKAWIEGNFTADDELQIHNSHADVLASADQKARLYQALARDDAESAKRQMRLVDPETQTLARVRIALKTTPDRVINHSLAPALATDAGLLFDQASALRRIGNDEGAWSMLLSIPVDKMAFVDAERSWRERHIMARDALKAGKPDLAYELAYRHGLATGSAFADAEFLAGWIALRYLNKADTAINHFQQLVQAVTLPISRARGHYWVGRTREAMNRPEDAAAAYRSAAAYPETFYGQLALARLHSSPVLSLPATVTVPSPEELALIQRDERMRATLLLAELRERGQLRAFAVNLAREIEGPSQFAVLTNVLVQAEDRVAALRIAKLASYQRAFLPEFAPIIDLPHSVLEPSLVLAIVRQESEFDAGAISSAGARGLMQLMPASAKTTANTHKIPYRAARLSEAQYNLQLGAAHLGDAIAGFGGSYLLGVAAYNAGPTNVKRWMETYGDPRNPEVDPIDWIELIPYGETRNYVQRVFENLQVYRNRLARADQPLGLVADLFRPNSSDPLRVKASFPMETDHVLAR